MPKSEKKSKADAKPKASVRADTSSKAQATTTNTTSTKSFRRPISALIAAIAVAIPTIAYKYTHSESPNAITKSASEKQQADAQITQTNSNVGQANNNVGQVNNNVGQVNTNVGQVNNVGQVMNIQELKDGGSINIGLQNHTPPSLPAKSNGQKAH